MYVGRFAPSPTGALHFGSLVAAAASWLDARAAGGRWLVRIEDLDAPRTRAGADDDILRMLERLGLTWDGAVERQSERLERYRAALARLKAGPTGAVAHEGKSPTRLLASRPTALRSIPAPAAPESQPTSRRGRSASSPPARSRSRTGSRAA
jgi:glutamyl-Q tRNA(Asp) synthetase